MSAKELDRAAEEVASKPAPALGPKYAGRRERRVLFVPAARVEKRIVRGVEVVTARDLLS